MATARLTKRAVDVSISSCRDTFNWDLDLRGFGLKVTPKGAKSYVLQYRRGAAVTSWRSLMLCSALTA